MQVEYADYVHGIVPQVKLLLDVFREAKGRSRVSSEVPRFIPRQGSPSSGAHGGAGVRMTGSSILWIASTVLLGASASTELPRCVRLCLSFIKIPSEVEHELQLFVQPQAERRRRLAHAPLVSSIQHLRMIAEGRYREERGEAQARVPRSRSALDSSKMTSV